ncbi:MAG: hypothetical protein QM652_02230 [Legionella sp.]|uniref:hypothetical protein n=1 Tax=Legionella sp. TaxID=459 RepID=UPI0039E4C1AE
MIQTIETFINSLAAIIVRYHDSQKEVVLINPTKDEIQNINHAIALLKKNNYETELERIIRECTKKYSERYEFLTFIRDEIIFLRSQLNRETPFNNQEFEEFRKKITMLFEDFILLSKINKLQTHNVRVNRLDNKPLDIIALRGFKKSSEVWNAYGLLNSTLCTSVLCTSGECVEEELMKRFECQFKSLDKIEEQVMRICERYQNSLLNAKIKELQAQLDLEKVNHEKIIKKQEVTHSELKETQILIEKLNATLSEANKTITAKDVEINSLQANQVATKELLDKEADKITKLQTKENTLSIELSEANKTISTKDIEINSLQASQVATKGLLDKAADKITELQTKENTLSIELSEANKTISAKDIEINSLKASLVATKELLDKAADKITELQTKENTLSIELSEANKTISTKDIEINSLKANQVATKELLDKEADKITELQTKENTLSIELSEANGTITTLKQQLNASEIKIQELQYKEISNTIQTKTEVTNSLQRQIQAIPPILVPNKRIHVTLAPFIRETIFGSSLSHSTVLPPSPSSPMLHSGLSSNEGNN